MVARSTTVVFKNGCHTARLHRIDWGVSSGVFAIDPPVDIAPGDELTWLSESDGFLTGTEGYVTYWPRFFGDDGGIPSPAPADEVIHVWWNNPYVGSNEYRSSAPGPFSLGHQGGDGNNAVVRFTLQGAYGRNTCIPGFVWRGANANDAVCVRPEVRDQVAADNRRAAERRQPGGGAYGPNTCKPGYVWREAFPGDAVCVPPATRAQAKRDNADANKRIL